MAILEIGSEKQVQPADTSQHDVVDRCSNGMQMTVVVVAVMWKMVEQRADEQTCWGGGVGVGVGVGGGGSGAEKLVSSSAVTGSYPR